MAAVVPSSRERPSAAIKNFQTLILYAKFGSDQILPEDERGMLRTLVDILIHSLTRAWTPQREMGPNLKIKHGPWKSMLWNITACDMIDIIMIEKSLINSPQTSCKTRIPISEAFKTSRHHAAVDLHILNAALVPGPQPKARWQLSNYHFQDNRIARF